MWCKEKINGVSVGYEADDIAAGLVKTLSPQYKHTYLLTDDSDWLPLTSDHVTWCGIAGYKPRIRTPEVILDWVKQHDKFSGEKSTKAKKAFIWESHKDIWKFKSIFGDKSDGIGGDKEDPTKYSPYIDLFNPVSDFRIWEEDTFMEKVQYCLFKGRTTLPMTKIRDAAKNIPLFMSEY
jgi:5'-3' exonuclease